MAITFTNGKSSTRLYEEAGSHLNYLSSWTKQYTQHLNLLAADIFIRYKQLKKDFDAGLINDYTYRDYLKSFKTYLDNNPAPYNSELHAEEILVEVKAHFK